MDQRTRDLELLRQARGEVVQLEEIRKKIRGVEEKIRQCEENLKNGVSYEELSTKKVETMIEEIERENGVIQRNIVYGYWGISILNVIFAVIFMNGSLESIVSEYGAGDIIIFWFGEIGIIGLLGIALMRIVQYMKEG
ncbi:MAG: hypothetical protein E7260_12335 [Lachnospiraceae bacterium]|nr:hypothetical protein [Lachnospiraceae bacterium]